MNVTLSIMVMRGRVPKVHNIIKGAGMMLMVEV